MLRGPALLVMFALGEAAGRIEGQDGWAKAETEHYVVYAESGARTLEEVKALLELLYAEYAKAFKVEGKVKGKAEVRIHKNRLTYQRDGGARDSVAWYDPHAKRLASYEHPELSQFLAHEATHQFFDLVIPGFATNLEVPPWFNEGVAECFSNSRVQGTQIRVNVLDSENGARNVRAVQKALREGKLPFLEVLVSLKEEDFRKDSAVLYPAAWSFCHFLWNAPELNGKGTYREVLGRLLDAFKAGKTRAQAYPEAFVRDGKALSLLRLDEEWRAYIPKLKAPKK